MISDLCIDPYNTPCTTTAGGLANHAHFPTIERKKDAT